jgi:hypothetical protein
VGIFFTFSLEGGSFRRPGTRVADAPLPLTNELSHLLQPGDRIFNLQRWGSWFELSLPQNPVFVDSRIELFPGRVWNDYLSVSNGRQGWEAILDQWRVQAVAVNTDQQGALIRLMEADSRWRVAYRDDDGVILLRAGGLDALP